MRIHAITLTALVADAGNGLRDWLNEEDLAKKFTDAIEDAAAKDSLAVNVHFPRGEQLAEFTLVGGKTVNMDAPGFECPTCEPCNIGDTCPMPCTCGASGVPHPAHNAANDADCPHCQIALGAGPIVEAIPVTRNEETDVPF